MFLRENLKHIQIFLHTRQKFAKDHIPTLSDKLLQEKKLQKDIFANQIFNEHA